MAAVDIVLGALGLVGSGIQLCIALHRHAQNCKNAQPTIKKLQREFGSAEKLLKNIRIRLRPIENEMVDNEGSDFQERIDEFEDTLSDILTGLIELNKKVKSKFAKYRAASFIIKRCSELNRDVQEARKEFYLEAIFGLVSNIERRVGGNNAPSNHPSSTPSANSWKSTNSGFPQMLDTDVTLDFANEATPEGKVMQWLIQSHESRPLIPALVITGESGHGKSTALHHIRLEKALQDRFPHGFHYIAHGPQSTDIKNNLVRIAKETGGERVVAEMSRTSDLKDVSSLLANWCANKEFLLMVDDLFETNSQELFRIFLKIVSLGQNNKSIVVFTKRAYGIMGVPDVEMIDFGRKQPEISRKLLIRCAGMSEKEDIMGRRECEVIINNIIAFSEGMPDILSLCGRSVRNIVRTRRLEEKHKAWSQYYNILMAGFRVEGGNFLTAVSNAGDDTSFIDKRSKVIEASLTHFGDIATETGAISYQDLLRRLHIVREKQWVPPLTLGFIWGLPESNVMKEAQKFVSVRLLDVEEKTIGGTATNVIQIISYVHQEAIKKEKIAADHHASGNEEERKKHTRKGHETLLNAYANHYRLSVVENSQYRRWWEPPLRNDGYIFNNIAWHLKSSGRMQEFLWLMLSASWTIRQLQESGISQVLSDYTILINMINEHGNESDKKFLAPLEKILHVAILSSMFIEKTSSAEECAFQLQARLRRVAQSCPIIEQYCKTLQALETGPHLIPKSDCLTISGSSLIQRRRCESNIKMMQMIPQKAIAVCGQERNGTISLINTVTGARIGGWVAHERALTAMVVDSSGKNLFTCGSDSNSLRYTYHIKQWDIENAVVPADALLCRTGIGIVKSMDIKHDGEQIVCAIQGIERIILPHVDVWDSEGKDPVHQASSPHASKNITCIRFLRNHTNMVVSGGADGTVRLWNLRTGDEKKSMPDHRGSVEVISVTDDGTQIASAGKDNKVILWEPYRSITIESNADGSHSMPATCLAVFKTRDGEDFGDGRTTVISGSSDTSMRLWDFDIRNESNTWKAMIGHDARVACFALSHNREQIVSYSDSSYPGGGGVMNTWDLRCLRNEERQDHHLWLVKDIELTRDNEKLVSASWDKTLYVWDVHQGSKFAVLKGHTGFVNDVAITRDGKYIVSASHDKSVCVWNIEEKELIETFKSRLSGLRIMNCVCITSDNKVAVSGDIKGGIHVWSLNRTFEHYNMEWRSGQNDEVAHEITKLYVSIDQWNGQYTLYAANKDIISKWSLATKKKLDEKRAIVTGRKGMMREFGDTYDEAGDEEADLKAWNLKIDNEKIIYKRGPQEKVLARMERKITAIKVSTDGIVCVGTEGGVVAFMKAQGWGDRNEMNGETVVS